MLIESTASRTHWMAPNDQPFDEIASADLPARTPLSSGNHEPDAVCVFADGSCRLLDAALPADTLKAMLTVNGGEKIAPDALDSGYVNADELGPIHRHEGTTGETTTETPRAWAGTMTLASSGSLGSGSRPTACQNSPKQGLMGRTENRTVWGMRVNDTVKLSSVGAVPLRAGKALR